MSNGAFPGGAFTTTGFMSPEQIRRQSRQSAVEGILANVQQGLPAGASSFANLGLELGGAIGRAFGVEPVVSPEEEQAQFRQQLLGGIDLTNSQQLNQAARVAQQKGDLTMANWLADRAIALTPEPAEPITTVRRVIVEDPNNPGNRLIVAEEVDEQGRVVGQKPLGMFYGGGGRGGAGGRGGSETLPGITYTTSANEEAFKPQLDEITGELFKGDLEDEQESILRRTVLQEVNDRADVLRKQGVPVTANELFDIARNLLSQRKAEDPDFSRYEIDDPGYNLFDRSMFVTDFRNAVNQLYGAVGEPAPRQAAPSSGGPEIGAVSGGYRYVGGDPASPSSWEKI